MIKIRVRDCQSIEDATIEVEGFTVVTGANNSGKTAFMRAVRGPFINAPVGALVRHGKEALMVEITLSDGQTLGWRKGPKVKPTYIINGGKPIHPGREVPQEVLDLGVVPIVVGRDKFWPQIATQFSSGQFSGPVFLLDRPGSVMAEVVADVERVGRLSKALKLCESDRRSAASKLKVRKKDQIAATAELATFEGIDDVMDAVTQVEAKLVEAAGVATEVRVLRDLDEHYQARREEVASLRGIENVPVPDAQAVEDAREMGVDIQALGRLHARWDDATAIVGALRGIDDVPVPSVDPLEEAQTASVEIRVLAALGVRLDDAAQRARSWEQAVAVAADIAVDQVSFDKAAKLETVLAVMVDQLDRLAKRQAEVAGLEQELADATAAIEDGAADFVTLLGTIEQCPTCHTPMTETHLHGEVAS